MQPTSNRPGQRPANHYLEDNERRQTRRDRVVLHLIIGALCVILPPVGLVCAWRSERVNALARGALTVCALAASTLICVTILRLTSTSDVIRPVPVVPVAYGYDKSTIKATPEPVTVYSAPADEEDYPPVTSYTVTYANGEVQNVGDQTTGEETVTAVETPDDAESQFPVDPATYVTLVYAVTNNATYFHTQQICDLQNNSRILTLDEALAEGLRPCEKCAQQYIGH
ncbi:MAG: hypothetical protein IJJ23_08800 [Clostridia bacterium]|nr:hypothetical protein [Clostridia bacterium]